MRLGILPPAVKTAWDDCDTWTQAKIIAFNQTCEHDELDEKIKLAGGK